MSLRTAPLMDASVGEQEQDANSALTELDKGLRSTKIGEQCEAIVRFPRLFEKYPFPILINSSFLKLSDVFRNGNNFLRLWILRVCQQSEKHLDKILNVDEFLRRIFSNLHSNDSVARALALRTLGAVAGIIPERENVHHAIRKGLESHDDVEVDAAIYATTRFAKHSSTFALAICDKLSDMVECENTGAERRDKLIYALRTVHGKSIFGGQRVLKLLSSLMEKFPSASSVKAAINSITFIASDTVLHVPEQVEVLLSIAVNDGRASVRRSALIGLRQLAVHAALWTPDSVQSLVLAAAANRNVAHTQLCLQVMRTLVKCPGICATAGSIQRNRDGNLEPSLLRQYCYEAALSVEPYVAAIAAQVLTDIVVHCYKECLPVEGADLMLALESLVVATGLVDDREFTKPLRMALKCMVDLSTVEPSLYAERTSTILGHQLSNCDWITDSSTKPEVARLESILEAMGALGGSTYCPKSIQPAMPAVVDKLQYRAEMARDNIASNMDTDQSECSPNADGTALVLLCTIACQERAGVALTTDISDEWEQLVVDALADSDAWTVYRVARAALRYAHHGLGARLLWTLVPIAPTEPAKRWLTALHKAATADHMLAKQGLSGVDECASLWRVAADGAGAAGWCGSCGGCDSCSGTSRAWLSARSTALWSISRVCVAARALCTQPPPAVAHAHAQANREPCTRAGAVCSSLVRASRSVRLAAEKYALIARTAFHADNATLRHLNIIQHNYNLLSQFLERITCSNYQEKQVIELSFSTKELKATNLEEKILLNISEQLQNISDTLFNDPSTKPGITHRHMEAVLAACRYICVGVGWALGAVGGGAGARCRLSLSPPPHTDPHPLNTHHHLALHVDGVILPPTHTHRKRKEERQVKGVQLTVTVTPHPRSSDKSADVTNVPALTTAVQTVTPVRDFFSAQQLISVQTPGLYTVAVEAAFIDEKADLWLTGTKSSIIIKAHEDQTTKGTTQTARRF